MNDLFQIILIKNEEWVNEKIQSILEDMMWGMYNGEAKLTRLRAWKKAIHSLYGGY